MADNQTTERPLTESERRGMAEALRRGTTPVQQTTPKRVTGALELGNDGVLRGDIQIDVTDGGATMARDEIEVAYAHGHTAGGMKARAEIERLRAGFLWYVQRDNDCRPTGKPCREPERCGCALEMEGALDEP